MAGLCVLQDRPDFIKIIKAINQKKEALLDPHKPLSEELLAEDKAEKVGTRGERERGR